MPKKITKWEPDNFELEMTTHWSFPKRGQGYADVGMGTGAIVTGLAAIFIGLTVSMKIKPNFVVSLIGVVGGGIVYFIVYSTVIYLGLDSNYLKML